MVAKVLVIGGNFSGVTAALELKRKGKQQVDVTVISRTDQFLFIPSLIWVPFGRREVADIQIPLAPLFSKHDVEFIHGEAFSVDPAAQVVKSSEGDLHYDHLVIATGPKVDFDVAPGVREFAHYIGTPDLALKTRDALEAFKKNPGPIVIGASQKAGCMGAAYEFLFNIEKWLREQGIRKQVELTWVTPEDYLGHFGIDGIAGGETMLKGFMKMFNIHYRTQVGIESMDDKQITLTSGESLPYDFSMIMPPFIGVDFITQSTALRSTETGYLPVNDFYQHEDWNNIWGAGIAVNVVPPFTPEKVPYGVPKTGFPADETGKAAAHNILATLNNQPMKAKPWGRIPALCIMDAGKKEVLILGSSMFKPRGFAIMLPNIIFDFSKVLFEKYFLWKTKNGYSFLP